MGIRKRQKAEKAKEEKKDLYIAKLNNCPTSPRKMRLMADLIRGKDVFSALSILKFSKKHTSIRLEKLLLSAVSNWKNKVDESTGDTGSLYIKEVFVDSAKQLKRIRPAPQGRAHRIRKRSNHVVVILDTNKKNIENEIKE